MKVGLNQMSLLHLAVIYRNGETVVTLLKVKTLDQWGTDEEGNTPLHLVCESKRKDKKHLKQKIKILLIFLTYEHVAPREYWR